MDTDLRWKRCVEAILSGKKIEFGDEELDLGSEALKITASSLAEILIGLVPTEEAEESGIRRRSSRLRHRRELPFTATVHLDGGAGCKIWIVSDDGDDRLDVERDERILDLTNLCNALGGAVPPLILKNCVLAGWFDISGSHFASMTVEDCRMRGFAAVGAQIDGDCYLRELRPLMVPMDARSLCEHPERYCQVRMVSSRIDGSVYLSGSLLRSPTLEMLWPGQQGIPPQKFSEQFAVSLASSEINGRVHLLGDFEAWGGVSLYQAEIHNSIRITSSLLLAHEAREFPDMPAQHSCAALDLSEMRLKGTLAWEPQGVRTIDSETGNVYGRVELIRASIGGDVHLQNVRWFPLRKCNDGRPVEQKVAPPYRPRFPFKYRAVEDPDASGGIDGRYVNIAGQFRIADRCRIGRRYRPMSGLRRLYRFGPSLDFWKGTFGLGLRLESRAELLGPIQLNATRIGRQAFIACDIRIETNDRPQQSPFHLALDLSDSRMDGNMVLRIPRADGRVTLERAQVDGSIEFQRLGFKHRHVRRANYGDKSDPPDIRHAEARHRERFDETSILDLQDLAITGGINLKREAISVDCDPAHAPHNNFIVDLRGMSCTTWDDAESTCWKGLNQPKREGRVPWRLRFDGISFRQLDNSSQNIRIDRWMETGASWLERARERLFSGRSYHVPSGGQVKIFRLNALNSFHDNRNRLPGRIRPENGMEGAPGPNGLSAWARFRNHLYRWTIAPTWKRREDMPVHSPQPFEVFARAYMARGEADRAIEIAVERMRLQWRKRVRLFTRSWFLWSFAGAAGLAVLPLLWQLGLFSPHSWTTGWTAFALVLFAVMFLAPAVLYVMAWLWGVMFGFGLRSRRALLSAVAFVLFVTFATPPIVGERIRDVPDLAEHLVYALDKLLPVVDRDIRLYPPTGQCHQPPLDDASVSPRPGQGADAGGDPPFHSRMLLAWPCAFRFLDSVYDIVGWIILSLSLLTLSGLLRREIDRYNS